MKKKIIIAVLLCIPFISILLVIIIICLLKLKNSIYLCGIEIKRKWMTGILWV